MKSGKVKEGYTVHTIETGQRFRIVQFDEHEFNIQMIVINPHYPDVKIFTKYGKDFKTLEDALGHIRQIEISVTEDRKFPIYH